LSIYIKKTGENKKLKIVTFLQNRIMVVKNCINAADKIVKLYAYEGFFGIFVALIISNNNILFAIRLGADDYMLSFFSLVPSLVTMIILFPGGIITDFIRSKKKMLITLSIIICIIYFIIGFLPFFTNFNFFAFLILVSISAGAWGLHNMAWQAYFPEAVATEKRNTILTIRTFIGIVLGIMIPCTTGFLLTHLHSNTHKIIAHQSFFIANAVFILFQINILRKINPIMETVIKREKFDFKIIKKTCVSLIKNKYFIIYIIAIQFFQLTSSITATLGYIGQIQYLHLDEAQLSYIVVGGTVIQFITLPFWSKFNERKGVVYTMLFGMAGAALNPIVMIISTSLSPQINKPIFIIVSIITSLASIVISLNSYQCLLQVLDEKYKTISLSLYSLITSFIVAVMPVVGVFIYKSFGSDLTSFHKTYWLVFVLRILSIWFWWFYWKKYTKKNKKST